MNRPRTASDIKKKDVILLGMAVYRTVYEAMHCCMATVLHFHLNGWEEVRNFALNSEENTLNGRYGHVELEQSRFNGQVKEKRKFEGKICSSTV